MNAASFRVERHRAESFFILLTIITAFIFINGLSVIFSKSFGLSPRSYIYFMAFMAFIASGLFFALILKGIVARAYFWVAIASIVISVSHDTLFGTRFGSDSAYYFSFPQYFFNRDIPLNFTLGPFYEYGDLPLQTYWIPNNLEYFASGIQYLFGGELGLSVSFFSIFNNALFYFSVISLFYFFGLGWKGTSIAVSLFLIVYLLLIIIGPDKSIASMGPFRSFDNKGLIFGFYYIATVIIFLFSSARSNFIYLALIITPFSAAFVSHNFVLLAPIGVALSIIALGFQSRLEVLLRLTFFLAPIVISFVFYSLLTTVDVYSVLNNDLTPRITTYDFNYVIGDGIYVWFVSLVPLLYFLIKGDRKLGWYSFVFLIVIVLANSPVMLMVLDIVSPEKTVVYWRFSAVLNPLPLIILGIATSMSFFGRRSNYKFTIFFGLIIVLLLMYFIKLVRPPYSFFYNNYAPVKLLNHCSSKARVLTNNVMHVPANAGLDFFFGKLYFLNWQIKNLSDASQSDNLAFALMAKKALISSYSKSISDEDWGNILALNPDILILSRGNLDLNKSSLLYSERFFHTRHRNINLFIRKGLCDEFVNGSKDF